jgi:hypothetical protein
MGMGRHQKHTGGKLNSDEYVKQRRAMEDVSGQIVDLVADKFGIILSSHDRGQLVGEGANLIERHPGEQDG